MHQSVATINSPEFINLEPLDINPLMSKCEIKVFYLGENRNGSFISKETATKMAKTLRGAPIVGYYKKDKEDFADHGEQVVIDDEGIKFNCLTVPYGFVSPDAEVWFQEFEDKDDFGNGIKREYLMTTGYLWTGQYKEAELALEGDGRPHSMELDEKTLDGHWSENYKNGMEFFIINDAVFSKLCILGEDVEPCFEGSTVSAPNVSSSFSLDDKFTKTLYTMMQDLKFALEGGKAMEDNIVVEETPVENIEFSENVDNIEQTENTNIQENTEDISSESNIEESAEEAVDVVEETADAVEEPIVAEEDAAEESDGVEEASASEDFECKDNDKDEKYALLEEQYKELESKFADLTQKYEKLVEFKNEIDDAKKDELINSFYMLDEIDKKDIVENKSQYTLDEIEAKLSIIFARKSISAEHREESKEEVITTYSLADDFKSVPDWVAEVQAYEKTK